MARSRRLEIQIVGDASSGVRSLGQIESRMGRTSRAFGRFGKAAAIGIGAVGVAGAAAVVAVGRDLANIERLNAQTATAIRSSGGAANVSARQVGALAERIQAFSGIQRESIQEGQNLLLTFHNIRNEAGKGNDIFDRTTRIMADMSTAMGVDASETAIQLGKALNDPIRGLTALTRVGVTFTDRQKEWITHLVETGDTIGAQRVILSELQSEFGGSARAFGETTAGQFSRAKEAIMDAAESLVVRLMPAATTAIGWIRTEAIPVIQEWADWLGPRLTAGFDAVSSWVQRNWPQIQTTITNVITNVRNVIDSAVSAISTVWGAFGDDIMGVIQRVWPPVQQIVEGVMNQLQGVIQTVSGIIKGDWGQVWDGIRNIVKGVWNAILGITRGALAVLRGVIGAAWQVVTNVTTGAWRGIKRFLGNIWDGIKDGVRSLKDSIGSIWERVKSVVAAPVNWIVRNVVNPFLGFIREIAGFVGLAGAIPGPFGGIGGGGTSGPGPSQSSGPGQHRSGDGPGIGDGLGTVFAGGPSLNPVTGNMSGMVAKVSEAIAGFGRLLGMLGGPPPFKGVMGGMMRSPIDKALSFFKDYKKTLGPALSSGIGWQALWAAVSGRFPDAQLFSSFRPGAITATGNQSYHALGRAIDISPRMDIFDWIVANYGKASKEIIFSPAGGRQIWNGAPHVYGEPTRGDHWDHIHWAMRKGTGGWVKAKEPTRFIAGDGVGTEYVNVSRTAPGAGIDEDRLARKIGREIAKELIVAGLA